MERLLRFMSSLVNERVSSSSMKSSTSMGSLDRSILGLAGGPTRDEMYDMSSMFTRF